MTETETSAIRSADFDGTAVALAQVEARRTTPRFEASPLLGALRAAGTSHVYADTASREELAQLLTREGGALPSPRGRRWR